MGKRRRISTHLLGDMKLIYEQDEQGHVGMVLVPGSESKMISRKKEYRTEPLIQAKILGDDYPFGFSQGRTMRGGETVERMAFVCQEKRRPDRNTVEILTRFKDSRGFDYEHRVFFDRRYQALETDVLAENRSQDEMVLEMLSSFTLGALTPFAQEAKTGQLVLHRMRSTWSAEGRLDSRPVEHLQLEPSWQRFSSNSIRFGQAGSMPVRGFVPWAAVEDTENGVTWAVQLTHGSSWQLEACRRDEALVLSGGLADREFGHWQKRLKSGECFRTPAARLTAVKGGVSEAAARLTGYMRRNLELPESERGKLPVIFNEFCTSWGAPREQDLETMAKLLKGRGIEYFVIDAGWYVEDDCAGSAENWDAVGDWEVSRSRFPSGMRKAADKIRSCGMKPGIWFEFEVAGRGSRLFEKSRWMLKRDGYDIVSGNRKFLDLRKPEVQEYLAEKVIRFLKDNGLEYLKVDYNESVGIGCDTEGELTAPGEGLRLQIQASLDFFRKIHRELPQLVIEVCSSGGHRLVPSFLETASMASFSDAHECDEIPVIAANMHRMILPRQSQIWAVLQRTHSLEKIYYRMTGTMLGRMCVSGDIRGLNKRQWAAVQEGIDFYHGVSHLIDCGTSSFQGPYIESYRRPEGWQAVLRQNGEELLVVFHSFGNAPSEVEAELPAAGETELSAAKAELLAAMEDSGGWRIDSEYHAERIKAEIVGRKLRLRQIQDFDGAALLLKTADSTDRDF